MAEYFDDGTFDWSLGQDSWHDPDRIRPNQYAKGVNVTTKGGVLSPRSGFHQLELTFAKDTIVTSTNVARSIEAIWRSGKFQAFIPFPSRAGSYFITVISGLIYRTNVATGYTFLLSKDIKLNQYSARVNWTYAADKVVLFDFPAYPVIIDESEVRRSDPTNEVNGLPAPEVPISTIGAYNQNRLFIGNNGVEFIAGDATNNLATPEAPLTFTEVFAPSSPYVNQQFSLPVEETVYPITAMGFIQALDSSTGIGPLFIASQKKLYAFAANQPRANWDQSQFGSVILDNAGIAGPRAFVNVNSDLIFLSDEGNIHAMSTARNDAKRWGNVPISREVDDYLIFNDISLRQYAVLGYFQNKVFITANPYRVQALDRNRRPVSDYAHGGMVVLEIDQLASFLSEGTPAWAGLWTGVNPMDMNAVGGRYFVVSKDGVGNSGQNAIYEVMPDSTYDLVNNRKRPIKSIIYTRQYSFTGEAAGEFALKRESTVAMHLQDIVGNLKLKIERRPSHSSEWLHYTDWTHNAPSESCTIPSDEFINGLAPHQFRELIFGDAKVEGCSPLTGDEYITFRALQYRLTLEGEGWKLENFKTRASLVPYTERQEEFMCSTSPAVKVPLQCDPDWLIPEETLCQPQ